MISLDTNILLPAVESRNPHHAAAAAFVEPLHDRKDVAVSEFILLELYGLLRNPAVLARPLPASTAAEVCESFRQHPRCRCSAFLLTAALSTIPSGPACGTTISPAAAPTTGARRWLSSNKV